MKTKFITFYQRFISDIQSGRKTITIRDNEANYFQVGDMVNAYAYENREFFASLSITAIEPLAFDEINAQHAMQENMTRTELEAIIKQIYPDTAQLYLITFICINH